MIPSNIPSIQNTQPHVGISTDNHNQQAVSHEQKAASQIGQNTLGIENKRQSVNQGQATILHSNNGDFGLGEEGSVKLAQQVKHEIPQKSSLGALKEQKDKLNEKISNEEKIFSKLEASANAIKTKDVTKQQSLDHVTERKNNLNKLKEELATLNKEILAETKDKIANSNSASKEIKKESNENREKIEEKEKQSDTQKAKLEKLIQKRDAFKQAIKQQKEDDKILDELLDSLDEPITKVVDQETLDQLATIASYANSLDEPFTKVVDQEILDELTTIDSYAKELDAALIKDSLNDLEELSNGDGDDQTFNELSDYIKKESVNLSEDLLDKLSEHSSNDVDNIIEQAIRNAERQHSRVDNLIQAQSEMEMLSNLAGNDFKDNMNASEESLKNVFDEKQKDVPPPKWMQKKEANEPAVSPSNERMVEMEKLKKEMAITKARIAEIKAKKGPEGGKKDLNTPAWMTKNTPKKPSSEVKQLEVTNTRKPVLDAKLGSVAGYKMPEDSDLDEVVSNLKYSEVQFQAKLDAEGNLALRNEAEAEAKKESIWEKIRSFPDRISDYIDDISLRRQEAKLGITNEAEISPEGETNPTKKTFDRKISDKIIKKDKQLRNKETKIRQNIEIFKNNEEIKKSSIEIAKLELSLEESLKHLEEAKEVQNNFNNLEEAQKELVLSDISKNENEILEIENFIKTKNNEIYKKKQERDTLLIPRKIKELEKLKEIYANIKIFDQRNINNILLSVAVYSNKEEVIESINKKYAKKWKELDDEIAQKANEIKNLKEAQKKTKKPIE